MPTPPSYLAALDSFHNALSDLIQAEMTPIGSPNTVHFLVQEQRRLVRLGQRIDRLCRGARDA